MNELENEINNRFLDLRKFFIETCPNVDVKLLLKIYHLESILNGCAIVYNLENDQEQKQRILKNYTETVFDLYEHSLLLKEQLKK